jgi:hypothetical protein
MASANDLLPLGDSIHPKSKRPNLVENIHDALANPERTLRDYLFTPGIRGYFDRILQDVREGQGGGYWVQAEYGGGKTHFLSTLLCLLGEAGDTSEEKVWQGVTDPGFRSDWEKVVRPRRLLGAHTSLMGTSQVLGTEQPRLMDIIDRAIIDALRRHGHADPGVSASSELLDWLDSLQSDIRAAINSKFKEIHDGMTVEEFRDEADDDRAARGILEAANALGVRPDVNLQAQDHVRHALDRVRSLGFDGMVIVVDEYFSRENILSAQQQVEDGSVLETIGYKLGVQDKLPVYLVVASQSPTPAKLSQRFTPMVLLKDQEREYSQIVCKRVMDYEPKVVDEQSVLYHEYFSNSFQFLRRTAERETREIFPFQPAVFRYLRDLVGSSRMGNAPSARFAIGVAYDAISKPEILAAKRFVTVADLLAGSLESDIVGASEMKEAAAALRQARDFIDSSDWDLAYLQPFAHRIVNHLFLHSVVQDKPQTLEAIVDGTLVEAPGGTLLPRDVAKIVLKKLQGCEQIEAKQDTWRFAARVVEGVQFEPVFQKTKRDVKRDDPRLIGKWIDLLTAPPNLTQGVQSFLSTIVTPLRIDVDHCGVEYPAKAVYAPNSLTTHLDALKRLTQPDRARVVFAPKSIDPPPTITDPAIALVIPGDLPESALDDLRGILACEEIVAEYALRPDVPAEKVKVAAEQRNRELTRSVLGRQKDVFRSGEILTMDGIALSSKNLFKDSARAGAEGIANQLVSHAYPSAGKVLNAQFKKRSPLAPADAQKVFDGIFGGLTESKTKGAAELYGPVLGLALQRDPMKLSAAAENGPAVIAGEIANHLPQVHMDDLYDKFCSEPYGLSSNVIDLLVLGCIGLGKPVALELRLPTGVNIETRDRRPYRGSIRASQLRHIAWPKDGLKGGLIVESNEVTWNDFAPVAQAVDAERFSMTSDAALADHQQKMFVDRLSSLDDQWAQTSKAIRALMEASGANPSVEAQETMAHIRGFVALRQDFDREAALNFVKETWGEAGASGVKDDIGRLSGLAQLVGEAGRLAPKLGWFRTLSQQAPEALRPEIEMARSLLSLEYITGNAGQLAVAMSKADELHARFMTRFREEHKQYVAWQRQQHEALAQAASRLPTLRRLNQIPSLGTEEPTTAARDIERLQNNLEPCQLADRPDVGQGTSCLSCGFSLGDLQRLEPVGENARKHMNDAILKKSRALTQGLIAETLKQAGNSELNALLVAAQAGSFQKIVEEDLLSDELVKLINDLMKKSKQQTVPSAGVFEFLNERPSITAGNLDAWLADLRALLLSGLTEARKANPGKEVTLLLKAGDDD